jgi:hypothetical protein
LLPAKALNFSPLNFGLWLNETALLVQCFPLIRFTFTNGRVTRNVGGMVTKMVDVHLSIPDAAGGGRQNRVDSDFFFHWHPDVNAIPTNPTATDPYHFKFAHIGGNVFSCAQIRAARARTGDLGASFQTLETNARAPLTGLVVRPRPVPRGR